MVCAEVAASFMAPLPPLRVTRSPGPPWSTQKGEISLTCCAGGRKQEESKLLRGQGVWPALGHAGPSPPRTTTAVPPVPIIISSTRGRGDPRDFGVSGGEAPLMAKVVEQQDLLDK